MTHDELLANIDGLEPIAVNCNLPFLIPYFKALRAVVELHKPAERTLPSVFNSLLNDQEQAMVTRTYCEKCGYRYPCPEIQVIEKELK